METRSIDPSPKALPGVPTVAASRPPVPSLPSRVGKLLLAYGDQAQGGGELLTFPKSVGNHLRDLLCAAGYVTAAPQLGIFASDAANRDFAVTTFAKVPSGLH